MILIASKDIELPERFAFSPTEANVEFSTGAFAGIGTVSYAGDLRFSLAGRGDLVIDAHRSS
jgi:hypothetical protein